MLVFDVDPKKINGLKYDDMSVRIAMDFFVLDLVPYDKKVSISGYIFRFCFCPRFCPCIA